MRRILLTAASLSVLTLTAPGAALAGQRRAPGAALAGQRQHRHHHKSRAHHARVSFRHLGPAIAGPVGPGAAPTTSPTPAAPTPATTPSATEENAGKVTSYTGGVLTLTLGDGSTVSGKVTIDTRFECVSATPTPPTGDQDEEGGEGNDNGWGDDQGGGDRNQGGGWQNGQQPQAGGQWQGGEDGGGGPGEGQDDGEAPISTEPPCDSSALTEGAIVRAAELRIAPGGTEFESIELVR